LASLAMEDDAVTDGITARRTTRAASSDSSTLATHRGPPVMPDTCTAPERILVESPRHCESHGWTARVRLQPDRAAARGAGHGDVVLSSPWLDKLRSLRRRSFINRAWLRRAAPSCRATCRQRLYTLQHRLRRRSSSLEAPSPRAVASRPSTWPRVNPAAWPRRRWTASPSPNSHLHPHHQRLGSLAA
jgi:hypothetical protein